MGRVKSIKKSATVDEGDKYAISKKKTNVAKEDVTLEIPLEKPLNYEDSKGYEEFKQSIGRMRKV
jgi:hypothetical protein